MSTQPAPRWSAPFLAALATAAVPGLVVVATRHPRTVTEHVETTGVLDSEGRSWVVRAPRDAATGAAIMAESALLQHLSKENLPFAVAVPAGFAELPDGGRAVVHHALPGREVALGALEPGPGLAASLGTALAALHEVPTSLATDAGVPSYDAETTRTRLLAEVDAMAQTTRVPITLLRRWEEALEDVRLWRFRPVLVHGDLAQDRVLAEKSAVTGLLDLTSAHVGDPATDLAWLVASAPEDALESVLESYALGRVEGGDGNVLVRAQLLSELALGRWLMHGIRLGDDVVVAEAQEMLTELAAAVDDATSA